MTHIATRRPVPFPEGAGIFIRMHTRLGCHGRPPHFAVEFYPYANLTHTIRLREETAFVRLSDVVRDAPMPVLEAAAGILLARLYRRRLPGDLAARYREYALARGTRMRLDSVRRRRARHTPDAPAGAHHDLAAMYARLNRQYFGGRLRRPRLAWSRTPWRRQLGIYDAALNRIVLSSRLDRPNVPTSVVEYVLYHEMLHVKHPVRRARCGLQSHSADFRREEKRFRHYEAARRFLLRSG